MEVEGLLPRLRAGKLPGVAVLSSMRPNRCCLRGGRERLPVSEGPLKGLQRLLVRGVVSRLRPAQGRRLRSCVRCSDPVGRVHYRGLRVERCPTRRCGGPGPRLRSNQAAERQGRSAGTAARAKVAGDSSTTSARPPFLLKGRSCLPPRASPSPCGHEAVREDVGSRRDVVTDFENG
jgi:hypothetical protein